ncbi:acetylserotonin O-methyltransferase [Pseudonocardia sp. ICBG1293]|uniref:acetylserotonin O-methyltransferase n=1 Tax=Pseudonocardia sp. ICBG1293 TaxID=2844382 RepID=UPI001CCDB59D|nr:acetylserotonin O-methyltransferase [Pseudonocardia sp. ICBG1293]
MSTTATPPGPPPGAVMIQLMGGFQISQAVYVIGQLGVATILEQEGPTTVAELAARTGSRPEPLGRLIRTLAPVGVFTTDGDLVSITPVGATLSEKHPESLLRVARMRMETHYLPFSELLHSVVSGEPGATKYLGEPMFDWISRDADRSALFSGAMADITAGVRTGMFDGYRLPAGEAVADIGGSDGSVLVELLTRDGDTRRRGIVFDLPTTVPNAEPTVAAAGLRDRVELVGGDFFRAVPTADVYILGHIFHDWDDESCRRILASITAAAPSQARVLLIEGVVPDGDEPHLSKAVDLTMLGMLPGRERTEQEYRDLLAGAGFTLDRVVATPGPYSILEATAP